MIKQPIKPNVQAVRIEPATPPVAGHSGFDLLLKIEADSRRADTVGELKFLIANETLKLSHARQIFVLVEKGRQLRVAAVSSIGTVESNSPRIRWIESVLRLLGADAGVTQPREFNLPAYCRNGETEHLAYPYKFMLWLPFKLRNDRVFGGMLLARDTPWNEADTLISKRLSETYSHAWAALSGPGKLKRRVRLKPVLTALAVIAIIAGFYPVPLTVLAPTEVTAIEPRIIAAPIDGVVETILVDPNAEVIRDQPLLKMTDTALRNELAVAEQDVKVAEARLMQVSQGAVADPKIRGDLAVTRSEVSVAQAKRDYARDMLQRTMVTAPAAGVIIYTDKRDWIGRPVSTGERVMEIADPNRLQLRIDVPVADAIALQSGARVRAFLDSDPLRPAMAIVKSSSYEASMVEGNVLAYRVYATLEEATPGMRLGIRGTAQISGQKMALAYYLFRRPIAAMRQRFGL